MGQRYRRGPVPSLEIHPLSELRAEAAGLLAERFARQRAAEPLLPEVDDFEPHVPVDGHVATRGGDAVAYLAGAVDGDTARWLFAGHAAREPEALRDLFEVQAGELGVSRFMLTVPASEPELVDAWFRLAFGCQAVWAVREVESADAIEFGGVIRPAARDDAAALIELDQLLFAHQAVTPSFSGLVPATREELQAEIDEIWDDDTYIPFVAETDAGVVGTLGLYRRPEGDLRVPAHNIDLAFAATRDEVRGSGVGRALSAFAVTGGQEHGFHSMTVDWRSVNLLSSRFWPRRGFRPQYLRLYRAVP
jgi:GNAT superfamily N-acetyltransferase